MSRVSIEVLQMNATKVHLGDTTLLFSYSAVVAAWKGGKVYRLDKAPTRTTARHLNTYTPSADDPQVIMVSAEELESLLAE